MRRKVARTLSWSGLTLGTVGWLVFLVGFGYALTLSPECAPGDLLPARVSAGMETSTVAWWFSLAGLPIALVSVGVSFRNWPGWVAVAVNAAFWFLMWGWIYGDVAPCHHR